MQNVKSEDLLYIEKCFTAIKNKVGVEENLKKISSTLKRIFDLNFTISIVDNDNYSSKNKRFFGMTIYPEVSTMDILVNSILNKSSAETLKVWEDNKDWYLEIDSILLYDTNLNANPKELVAVLLHEIGHVVYANTIPQKLHKYIRLNIAKFNYQLRQLIATEKISKLFNLAIIETCSSKTYSHVDVNTEREADKFVVKYGYGDELNNFIDKLLKTQGSTLIDRTDAELDSEAKGYVEWVVVNITELEYRKTKLKDTMKTELLKNPSKFAKTIVQDIYHSFFGEATDKYRELLCEQSGRPVIDTYSELMGLQNLDKLIHTVMKESLLSNNIFDKHGKLKKITQNDIDILTVEAERIETVDDKIYLLDKLYSQLELVETGLEYIESKKNDDRSKVSQSKNTLLDMKKQLEELRSNILAKKIIEKSYGVFIKYPSAYNY